ncbi:G patch domain containing protein, putative [Perkinsus marinus ATCC 50983]|uniref:G patch domain containing protein, putative n=1 Tax=Perkinsus marinus (strain ATCC 50983 / TXsc) TaxID=423536 RepID=C5LU61_PERM5|nr:G patch domain containing protein, putative [Perkinsus marinus ATCC 50983]EEQ99735.1 G patch domain containing protein, putative [Perkinsus marinus ATCC 50983]|eukprot:XP_002767018.1 G patch domain containing protein, putative [Perkinsus marinus ATCC 50983]
MSRKYYERLVTSSGVTSKKFESNLGAKILGKFGWKTGDGLGAEGQGMTDCLQVKRREENEGLGRELEKKESSEWENWWADSYNAIAKKLASVATTSSGSEDSSDDSSEDEGEARTTAIKRADMQKGKLRRIMRQERTAVKKDEEEKEADKKSKKHRREVTKIRKSKRAAVEEEEEEVPKKKHKKSKKSKRSAEE